MSFGDYLRDLRKRKKIKLRELSGSLKVSITYLANIEKNDRRPFNTNKIRSIAKFLHLTEEEEEKLIQLSTKNKQRIEFDTSILDIKHQQLAVTLARNLNNGLTENQINTINEVLTSDKNDKS